MANRNFEPPGDPLAGRDRIIRQRNIALALVLAFFVLLFFAITVVKMKHPRMPHKSPAVSGAMPGAGGGNGA